ncbi:glycosyltransferase 87 family protein [Pseudonocardia abyssalis]|uniref:DUF2029 domain-containing protein n=1 Tax=Pseudonocardia abyssalis TaxID=2792008 RepID=A0ABS6UM82_9PSEU|nr:glycosyltransferase 87 family protein [Pseudonocardia abyssalis]MBW0115602.1 DUF2029 domain-containing protein [Pseudonocardia abyssalis]MBW0133355.1 DUF2029 domain-containing protein [Pseudonocardia abyssalis]
MNTRPAAAVVGAAVLGHAVVLAIWPQAHTLLIDLQVYRAGGELVAAGRPLYGGGVLLDLPFVYPPFAALVFVPLAWPPVPVLSVGWTVLGLVLLAVVVRRCGAGGPLLVAVVALATWLDPVRTTFYLGQLNLVLLALVVCDLSGCRESRWRGVGIGLAAALKLTPLLFVVYLLLTGRTRAAATAIGTFVAAGALGFLVAPADSVEYWLRGTFASAGRISDVSGPSNHSLAGFLARAGLPDLVPAALLAMLTLAVAVALHRRGVDLAAGTLVGLGSAAAAPFAWSHHWVWVVPLVVLLARRVVAGERAAAVALGGVLLATLAVITRLPGPSVGPIPATGAISLTPDAYLVLFVVVLASAAWSLRRA